MLLGPVVLAKTSKHPKDHIATQLVHLQCGVMLARLLTAKATNTAMIQRHQPESSSSSGTTDTDYGVTESKEEKEVG